MTNTTKAPAAGNIWHRRGCSCQACDIIRRGDVARTAEAVKR